MTLAGLCIAAARLFAATLLLVGLPAVSNSRAHAASTAPIAQQMEDFWQGRAHFQEVRDIDWAKPPYNSPREGEGWFGDPMPFPGGKWYIFNREWITKSRKPDYCRDPGFNVLVRESSDEGRTWSNPAVVAAKEGTPSAPDACGVADGSSYYDRNTDTWQMLAQCRAAHYAGGWMLCHYTRHGLSPMGPFTPDPVPAVRGGQLWAQICNHAGSICDPDKTIDEGTPDIIYKKDGYFYVTFHGYDYSTKHGFRGAAKTPDFHHWIVSASDLAEAPLFAAPQCQAWSPGCVGGGEASTLIAGDYQYMLIETPDSFTRPHALNWPFVLLRAPKTSFPGWSSSLWERFRANPLLPPHPSGPDRLVQCSAAYLRWAVAGTQIYILYADYGCGPMPHKVFSVSANRLLKLVPGASVPVSLRAH